MVTNPHSVRTAPTVPHPADTRGAGANTPRHGAPTAHPGDRFDCQCCSLPAHPARPGHHSHDPSNTLSWGYKVQDVPERPEPRPDPNRIRTESVLSGRRGWTTLGDAPDIRLALDTEQVWPPARRGPHPSHRRCRYGRPGELGIDLREHAPTPGIGRCRDPRGDPSARGRPGRPVVAQAGRCRRRPGVGCNEYRFHCEAR